MPLQIVAAPWRQMKTYTVILGVVIGSFDAFLLLMKVFTDVHFIEPTTALAINAVLGFLIVPAKLILQNIPTTTEEKAQIVEAAASQPIKEGYPNVQVKVEGAVVPNDPIEALRKKEATL